MSEPIARFAPYAPFYAHPALLLPLAVGYVCFYRSASVPALLDWLLTCLSILTIVLVFNYGRLITFIAIFIIKATATPLNTLLAALFFYLITLWQDMRRKTPPTRLELAADYTAHLANFAITLLWLTLARPHPHYAEFTTYFIIMTLLSGAALIRRTATALRQP